MLMQGMRVAEPCEITRIDQYMGALLNLQSDGLWEKIFVANIKTNESPGNRMYGCWAFATLKITQRYAHLTPEHLKKAINIVSFGGSPEPTPTFLFRIVMPTARPAPSNCSREALADPRSTTAASSKASVP